MTGPRPAGRPWTAAEEARLSELLASRMKVGFIARKLKRSPGAIYARINSVRKTPRDLAFAAQRRSLPFGVEARCHRLRQIDCDAGFLTSQNFLAAIVPAIGNSLDGLRTNRCARL